MHEIEHYLGLEHIDNEIHLMYSFNQNTEHSSIYNEMDLNIPNLERPEYLHTLYLLVQDKINNLNIEIQKLETERQVLKNLNASETNIERLDDITIEIENILNKPACLDLQ